MLKLTLKFVFTIFLSLFALANTVNATTYIFGDSLSDTGALGFTYTNIYRKNLSDYKPPIWVNDFFKNQNVNPVYCPTCRLNSNNFYYQTPGTTNYAVGGAGILIDSTEIGTPRGNSHTRFADQVAAFNYNGGAKSGDSIIVWIGANDILQQPSSNTLDRIIYEFKKQISNLNRISPNAKIYVITLPLFDQSLSSQISSFNSGINFMPNSNWYYIVNGDVLVQSAKYQYDTGQLGLTACNLTIDKNNLCPSPSNPIIYNGYTLLADNLHPSQYTHSIIANTLGHFIRH